MSWILRSYLASYLMAYKSFAKEIRISCINLNKKVSPLTSEFVFNVDSFNTYRKQLELKLCIRIELLKNRYIHIFVSRSSRPEVFCKKGV